jgi:hypothetical protein
MKKIPAIPLLIVVIFLGWTTTYFRIIRPWYMKWGAAPEEIGKPLPGDQLIPEPSHESLRVLTIEAPPENIWPWLIQIGQDRAAFYSYDWLENLMGVGYRNSDRIVPEWQDLQQGGFIRSVPKTWLFGLGKEEKTGRTGWVVPLIEPYRALYLRPWGAFVLDPLNGQKTRFYARSRALQMSIFWKAFSVIIFDTIHFVMEKRMMVEIKRLAEGRPAEPGWLQVVALGGFVLLSLVVAGVFVFRKRGRFLILLPLAYGGLIYSTSIDIVSALTGFLTAGLAIIGFLVFRRFWWAWYLALWIICNSILIFVHNAFLIFGWLFAVASLSTLGILGRKKLISSKL